MKQELCILHATSVRDLQEQVNSINMNANSEKESIGPNNTITVLKDDETFFLLYFKSI